MGGFNANESLVARLDGLLQSMVKMRAPEAPLDTVREAIAVLQGRLMIDAQGKLHEPCRHDHAARTVIQCLGCGAVTGAVPVEDKTPLLMPTRFAVYAREQLKLHGRSAMIPLIKQLRAETGVGLKEAKDALDVVWDDIIRHAGATLGAIPPSASYGKALSPGPLPGSPTDFGPSPLMPVDRSQYELIQECFGNPTGRKLQD